MLDVVSSSLTPGAKNRPSLDWGGFLCYSRTVTENRDTSVVPHNRFYCYDHVASENDDPSKVQNAYQLVPHEPPFMVVGMCPHLAISSRGKKNFPSGRCKLLDISDKDVSDPAGRLLWDLVKSCNIHLDDREE